jgi:hypothetical protein
MSRHAQIPRSGLVQAPICGVSGYAEPGAEGAALFLCPFDKKAARPDVGDGAPLERRWPRLESRRGGGDGSWVGCGKEGWRRAGGHRTALRDGAPGFDKERAAGATDGQ